MTTANEDVESETAMPENPQEITYTPEQIAEDERREKVAAERDRKLAKQSEPPEKKSAPVHRSRSKPKE